MSCRASSKRIEHKSEIAVNGQIAMNLGHDTSTEKSKVDFIYGAVPSRSKHDILLVLQSCDYNVETAISIFSQGQAEEVLKQWSYKGKKSKEGNKKKRNRKRQNTKDVKEESLPRENSSRPTSTSNTNCVLEQAIETLPGQVLSLDLQHQLPSASLVDNGISSPSNNSTNSSPDTVTKKTSSRGSSHSSSHQKHTSKQQTSKAEKLSPTSHADALKKSTKDLARSSFSLARYQVVLEEECEQSFKRISKTFENIRKCVNDREEFLTKALKEFKAEGDKLLQQRLEDAAALRLKTERVQSMPEEQVAFLRADIKSFVAERKIDEELAQTKRFVCDEEKIIQDIKTFGQVAPIKGTYTPVVLNHQIPSNPPKPINDASSKKTSSSVPSSSSMKPTPINASPAKSSAIADVKGTLSTQPTSKQPPVITKLSSQSDVKGALSTQPTSKQPPVITKLSSQSDVKGALSTQPTSKQPPVITKLSSQSVHVDNKENRDANKSTLAVNAKHTKNTTKQATKEVSSLSQTPKVTDTQSKKQTTLSSTTASKQPSARSTNSLKQTEVSTSHQKSANVGGQTIMPVDSGTSGPPPNIDKLISLAMAKTSAVVSGQDAINPPKSQDVLHTTNSDQYKKGALNQRKDHIQGQKDRPNSAQSTQEKQQHRHEPRPKRPQSNCRQGEDKEKEGRINQANTKDQHKLKQSSQSSPSQPPQEGKRKRQRRSRKDRKTKENNEALKTKDITEDSSQIKKGVSGQKEAISEIKGSANNAKIDSGSPEPYNAEGASENKENLEKDSNSDQQEDTQDLSNDGKATIDSCQIKLENGDELSCTENITGSEVNSEKSEDFGQKGENIEINERSNKAEPEIVNGVPALTNNSGKDVYLEKNELSCGQQEIEKIAEATSTDSSSMPKPDIVSSHDVLGESTADTDHISVIEEISSSEQDVSSKVENIVDDLTERNANHKDGTNMEDGSHEIKPNHLSTNNVSNELPSNALPQRSQRSQGRRRNRIADENQESSSKHGKNGSSNGLNHDSDNCDKEATVEMSEREKNDVEKNEMNEEIVNGKVSEVVAPSVFNGLDKCIESECIPMEINEKNPLENQFEIIGEKDIVVSNVTGDECLIER